MQEQYSKMRDDLKTKEFTGTSGNGLVNVVLDGEKALKKILIKPECVNPEDVEGLQDLIVAACQEAFKKADAEESEAGGLGGMPLPF